MTTLLPTTTESTSLAPPSTTGRNAVLADGSALPADRVDDGLGVVAEVETGAPAVTDAAGRDDGIDFVKYLPRVRSTTRATELKPIVKRPCAFCVEAGCDMCRVTPAPDRARTIRRLRAALHQQCRAIEDVAVEPETRIIGHEMRVRLRLLGNDSGYSWIDLTSLDDRGRRPIDWAAGQAVDECLLDLARYMFIAGNVPAIRYEARR